MEPYCSHGSPKIIHSNVINNVSPHRNSPKSVLIFWYTFTAHGGTAFLAHSSPRLGLSFLNEDSVSPGRVLPDVSYYFSFFVKKHRSHNLQFKTILLCFEPIPFFFFPIFFFCNCWRFFLILNFFIGFIISTNRTTPENQQYRFSSILCELFHFPWLT